MSQYDFGNLESPLPGSAFFNTHLEPWRNALHSGHSGNSRPSYAAAGMTWINTTTNPWVVNVFDGAQDIIQGYIDTSTNIYTPYIADATRGDIATSSLGGVWTIIANAITTSKIVNNAVTLAKLATQAANTVLVNATSSTAVPTALSLSANQLLGRGATGDIAPIALGTGLSMTGTTLSATAAASFESSEIAYVAGTTTYSASHGLGSVPKRYNVVFRCKTAEFGYAVGDELIMNYVDSSGIAGISSGCNATAVFAAQNGGLRVFNKSTSAAGVMTAANWRVVLRAWL